MAAEIQFATGVFHSFRATTKVHLGKLAQDIRDGDIVQFDGQTLKLGGVEHPYSELRAAIKVGWIVPEGDNISNYRPQSADVKVRAAQDNKKQAKQMPTTIMDDERDMGPSRRNVVKADDPDEATVVGAFSKKVQRMDEVERPVGRSTNRTASEVQTDSAGNEDARTVGKIRNPAVMRTTISDGAQAAQEAARLDNAPPPRAILNASKGVIHAAEAEEVETIIDVLNAEDHARVIVAERNKQILEARQLIAEEDARLLKMAARTAKADAKTAAKKRADAPSQALEGTDIYAAASENIGAANYALTPEAQAKVLAKQSKTAKAETQAETQAEPEKVAPKAQALPKRRAPVTVEEIVIQDGDIDLGNGVKWNKNIHWRSRAKIAAEQYGNNPTALAAIQAVEAPAVNALIAERLEALSKGA